MKATGGNWISSLTGKEISSVIMETGVSSVMTESGLHAERTDMISNEYSVLGFIEVTA
ncbi:hypothetical protein ABID42_002029 [Arcicella rosea]|uniref:hypothetical protein n=1 Tax=Arcicella rosea TaxID=502909 RepID=UPI00345D19CB